MAVLAAGGLLAVAGCAKSSVEAAPPTPHDSDTNRICRALHKALPGKLDGLSRRGTKPASDLTAAWGDDAIVLRCGTSLPAVLDPDMKKSYHPDTDGVGVNGVDWLPEKSSAGVRFTTVDREANVELWVPSHYAPGYTDPLVDLASVVKKTVPTGL
jgi:Protein of unknown function (DUF3515)